MKWFSIPTEFSGAQGLIKCLLNCTGEIFAHRSVQSNKCVYMCAGAQSCFLTLWLTQETVHPKHSLTLIAFQSCMTYFLLQNAKDDILRDVCPHNESQHGSKPKKQRHQEIIFLCSTEKASHTGMERHDFMMSLSNSVFSLHKVIEWFQKTCIIVVWTHFVGLFQTWQQVWKKATWIFFQTSPFGFHSQKESVSFFIQSNWGTFSGLIKWFMRQYCKSAIIFLKHVRVT